MTPFLYLSQLTIVVLLTAVHPKPVSSQLVTLRHPESASQPAKAPAGYEQTLKERSKPGNVIVHFDRNHDIQSLQYVMQDGRFANLYQRPPGAQHVGQHSGSQPQVKRGVEDTGDQRQPFLVGGNQTLDVLNAKLNGVSQILGERVVIELPGHPAADESSSSGSSKGSLPPEIDESLDGKLDVVASIAADAIHAGIAGSQVAVPKLRKAGTILNLLKGKVSSRLRDLPKLIDAKLQAKSSAGQVYMDQPNKGPVAVVHEQAGSKGSSIHQQQLVSHLQPVRQPAPKAELQPQAHLQQPLAQPPPQQPLPAPIPAQPIDLSHQQIPEQVTPPPIGTPALPASVARIGRWGSGFWG